MPDRNTRVARIKWMAEKLGRLAKAWDVEFAMNNLGSDVQFSGKWTSYSAFEIETEAMTEAYETTLALIELGVGNSVAMGLDLEPGWQIVMAHHAARVGTGRWVEDLYTGAPGCEPPSLESVVLEQYKKAGIDP